jgi:hypothetical protein
MMTRLDLLEYIAQRKYQCPFCVELQRRVADLGLDAINQWDGMICGSIEDMQIRLREVETGIEHQPLDLDDDLFA